MRESPEAIEIQISKKKSPVPRLKRRSDFLRAGKGDRFHARAFSLQAAAGPQAAAASPDAAEAGETLPPARFGLTVTKRIGGAVERNRIRRRLKEILRLSPDLPARPGHDYVIVAKAEALTCDFKALQSELSNALRKIHTAARRRPPAAKPARRKAP